MKKIRGCRWFFDSLRGVFTTPLFFRLFLNLRMKLSNCRILKSSCPKGEQRMEKKLYLDEETNQEEQQPQRDDKPSTPLVEKIQQLGETNVPQLSADSKIHCLTI